MKVSPICHVVSIFPISLLQSDTLTTWHICETFINIFMICDLRESTGSLVGASVLTRTRNKFFLRSKTADSKGKSSGLLVYRTYVILLVHSTYARTMFTSIHSCFFALSYLHQNYNQVGWDLYDLIWWCISFKLNCNLIKLNERLSRR